MEEFKPVEVYVEAARSFMESETAHADIVIEHMEPASSRTEAVVACTYVAISCIAAVQPMKMP